MFAMNRYWLLDCDKSVTDVPQLANQLFSRLLGVPFVAKFVVFALTPTHSETRLRIFCVTDDKLDKTLERHQKYREVARSQQVEVFLRSCPQFVVYVLSSLFLSLDHKSLTLSSGLKSLTT